LPQLSVDCAHANFPELHTQLTALHPSAAVWLHEAPAAQGCPLKVELQVDGEPPSPVAPD